MADVWDKLKAEGKHEEALRIRKMQITIYEASRQGPTSPRTQAGG
jgi:hypothetical protein